MSDVDLAVRRGSIHALIGPNGAGKTTCFNLLTKFLAPSAGTIVGPLAIIAMEDKLGDLGRGLSTLTGIEWFNTLGESVNIATGLLFVVCVLTFRRGITGELQARSKRSRATAVQSDTAPALVAPALAARRSDAAQG